MEVKLYRWAELSADERRALCRRAEAGLQEVLPAVRGILEEVRARGDEAVREYTLRFDGARLAGRPLAVEAAEIASAAARVPAEVRAAIEQAVRNVRSFHEGQAPPPPSLREISPGVFAGERWSPLDSVGLYVPRGRGSFPSVAYMLAVPAVLAGVPRVALATPPDAEGRPDPATLYAAGLCGVHEVYRVGGVQALAALAFGTREIPRVDKILGPGSLYVSAAKRALADVVDVGLPAGPSESIVLADEQADPRLAALDLMVEAEHGEDSSAFLVTPSAGLAGEVRRLLPVLLAELAAEDPQRARHVEAVLTGFGGIVLTGTLEQAADFVNAYAPEHLQLACREPFAALSLVRNAGEILLGQQATFSLANYAVGCNNVLPTGGWARSASALGLRDFLKCSSVVHVTGAGAGSLAGCVARLAGYEGFAAHRLAVTRRGPAASPAAGPAAGPAPG